MHTTFPKIAQAKNSRLKSSIFGTEMVLVEDTLFITSSKITIFFLRFNNSE